MLTPTAGRKVVTRRSLLACAAAWKSFVAVTRAPSPTLTVAVGDELPKVRPKPLFSVMMLTFEVEVASSETLWVASIRTPAPSAMLAVDSATTAIALSADTGSGSATPALPTSSLSTPMSLPKRYPEWPSTVSQA